MSPRQMLEQIGSYNNEVFEQEEKTWFDSVIYPVSTALTDIRIFQSDTKDRAYKNTAFPLSSTGALITKIRVFTDLEFTPVGTALENPMFRAHFFESSFLRFTIENKIVGEFLFTDLIDYNYISGNYQAAASQFMGIRPKLNNYFMLDIPIKIGAGKNVVVDLLLAKVLTASAVVANATPWHPNAGLVNNVGFVIKVYLKGFEYREAKGAA